MNRRLNDPNNHAPAVSPRDGWDDADSAPVQILPIGNPLPRRRTPPTRLEKDSPGLRIAPAIDRPEPEETPYHLEVQEIRAKPIRLEPTATSPPKAARQITFQERPLEHEEAKKVDPEDEEWGVAPVRHPVRLFVVSLVAMGVLVGLGIALLPFINAPNVERTKESVRPIAEEEIEGMAAINALITKQPEALQIFRSYATAVSVDDILPLLRDGKKLQSTLREHWRSLKVSSQWAPEVTSTWNSVMLGGRPCGVLEGSLPDRKDFRAIFTFDHDRLLLDWKATSAFGTATFKELSLGKGDPSEIRGSLSQTEFYTTDFPEESFRSLRLIDPHDDVSIWCYTRRGTLEDARIGPLFDVGVILNETVSDRRVTVRLTQGPSGAQPNQWMIAELLHEDWVNP
jgi:hypothetical protein